ncbi:hypothetical protein E2C01_084740 [Portunus trituberculatus]|uniref:Uncharacterized protein n=1 Tax=Portunus trituberculatus TaxID=210409 RepID=A0A5B7IZ32_PORTR|nr:hypothetical protein [Portunus trituberculatus]
MECVAMHIHAAWWHRTDGSGGRVVEPARETRHVTELSRVIRVAGLARMKDEVRVAGMTGVSRADPGDRAH